MALRSHLHFVIFLHGVLLLHWISTYLFDIPGWPHVWIGFIVRFWARAMCVHNGIWKQAKRQHPIEIEECWSECSDKTALCKKKKVNLLLIAVDAHRFPTAVQPVTLDDLSSREPPQRQQTHTRTEIFPASLTVGLDKWREIASASATRDLSLSRTHAWARAAERLAWWVSVFFFLTLLLSFCFVCLFLHVVY